MRPLELPTDTAETLESKGATRRKYRLSRGLGPCNDQTLWGVQSGVSDEVLLRIINREGRGDWCFGALNGLCSLYSLRVEGWLRWWVCSAFGCPSLSWVRVDVVGV